MTSTTPDRPKPENQPPGGSGVTPPRRVSEPVVYDEHDRLRIELPHPPDDHHFYPISTAALVGFVDQINALRAERDQLKAHPSPYTPRRETEITDEEIEELKQRINQPHTLTVIPASAALEVTDLLAPVRDQARRYLTAIYGTWLYKAPGDLEFAETVMTQLETMAAEATATPPMHPTTRDLNQMEGP